MLGDVFGEMRIGGGDDERVERVLGKHGAECGEHGMSFVDGIKRVFAAAREWVFRLPKTLVDGKGANGGSAGKMGKRIFRLPNAMGSLKLG